MKNQTPLTSDTISLIFALADPKLPRSRRVVIERELAARAALREITRLARARVDAHLAR